MSRFHLEIRVTPRPGVLDPEGKAIHHALQSLGYQAAAEVRVGKAIYLEMDAASAGEALASAEEMCRKLLANPVTEEYSIKTVESTVAGAGGER